MMELTVELTVLALVCVLIGLACLGGLAWAVVGSVDVGIDKIFLVHVWLIFALIFFGMAYWIARQGPLRKPEKEKAQAPAQKPRATTGAAPGAAGAARSEGPQQKAAAAEESAAEKAGKTS